MVHNQIEIGPKVLIWMWRKGRENGKMGGTYEM